MELPRCWLYVITVLKLYLKRTQLCAPTLHEHFCCSNKVNFPIAGRIKDYLIFSYLSYLMYSRWYAVLFLKVVLRVLSKQSNFSFIIPKNIFPVELCSVKVVFGKLQMRSNVFLESSGFLCGVLPWTPCLFNVLHIVDSSTEMLTSSNDSFKSLAFTRVLIYLSEHFACVAFEASWLDSHFWGE